MQIKILTFLYCIISSWMVMNTPISSIEFASYSGPKKTKTDRTKLLLYIAKSIDLSMLPLTTRQLKKTSKSVIRHLFDLKRCRRRDTLNDKKKIKKIMKRNIQEDIDLDEAPPSLKAKLTLAWRYKTGDRLRYFFFVQGKLMKPTGITNIINVNYTALDRYIP
ncbi:hypothetical protein BDF21DRAFT_397768 [Thamnidium elegans]|nr:hypothetical protein BDF21DRAFT_397768 [Thamnidium elegans]